jgi:hypothetical protein
MSVRWRTDRGRASSLRLGKQDRGGKDQGRKGVTLPET